MTRRLFFRVQRTKHWEMKAPGEGIGLSTYSARSAERVVIAT